MWKKTVGFGGAIAALLFCGVAAQADRGLRGDLNEDGVVDAEDMALLLSWWGADRPEGDLNSDGTINARDLAILVGLFGSESETPQQTMALGMNPSAVAHYTREWTFVDIFKTSRVWHSADPLAFGPEGWPRLEPGQQVSTLMMRGMDGHYPAGEYTVVWEGRGRVSIPGFDVVGASWSNPITDESGRFTFHVDDPRGNGVALRIDESDPATPVRNIRVIMPGFDPDDHPTFHPVFKERLASFEMIRFMAWCGVGQTSTVRWGDRVWPSSPSQSTARGVAVEHMVDLCNELEADPWFCMPHLATDNYMRQFARIVRDRLSPERTVYIEFSNEMWNAIFDQARWNFAEAERLGISFQEHYAQQSLRMFAIWEDVFTGQQDRLKRVVGTQRTNYGVTAGILDHIPQGRADVLSPAAYFQITPHLDPADITEDTPLSALFAAARLGIEDSAEQMAWQVERAEDHGLEVIAYEGGQHLANVFGGSHPSIDAFARANQDPRMRGLYLLHLEKQRDAGVRGVCHLGYVNNQDDQHGAWGALDHQTQPRNEAPKYDALLRFLEMQSGEESPEGGSNDGDGTS